MTDNSEQDNLTVALCLPGRGPRVNHCHAAPGWMEPQCPGEIRYVASLIYCCGDEDCDAGKNGVCRFGCEPESNLTYVCADHAIPLRIYWHNLEWMKSY